MGRFWGAEITVTRPDSRHGPWPEERPLAGLHVTKKKVLLNELVSYVR